MCELPGSSSRALSEIICDHCGKKAIRTAGRKREERENAKEPVVEMVEKTKAKTKGRTKKRESKGKEKDKEKRKRQRQEQKEEESACSICSDGAASLFWRRAAAMVLS